jgi:hypothetical protein
MEAHLARFQPLHDHPCVAFRKMRLPSRKNDVVGLVVVCDPNQPANAFDGVFSWFGDREKRPFLERHLAVASKVRG